MATTLAFASGTPNCSREGWLSIDAKTDPAKCARKARTSRSRPLIGSFVVEPSHFPKAMKDNTVLSGRRTDCESASKRTTFGPEISIIRFTRRIPGAFSRSNSPSRNGDSPSPPSQRTILWTRPNSQGPSFV